MRRTEDTPSDQMSDDPALAVLLRNEQPLEVDRERIVSTARRTAAAEGAVGEISIWLVTVDRIAELNSAYLGEEGPTDVLSFPVDGLVNEVPRAGPPPLIGEVVICPEIAAAQAKDGLTSELDLLVAHGVLHLLGFDHQTKEAAEKMRWREREITGRAGASTT